MLIREGARLLRPGTPDYDRAWVGMQLDRAPRAWQARIRQRWADLFAGQGEFGANTWLRETVDGLGATLLPMSASDADLRERANGLAAECFDAGARIGARALVDYWRACCDFVERKGVTPPPVEDGEESEIRAAVARMVCPLWWRRQVRREHGRAIERAAIRLGYVHLRAEKYVSQANVWRRVQQRTRNADTLSSVFVVNQHGQEFSLADLAERSTANPRIRRAELMTRIAGFERVAKDLGHVAEFWTGTAPSKYHAVRSADCRENPAWVEAGRPTPRDAQSHLGKCWARFRAWAKRAGVGMYGMRIAEPHHDGCPHWHMLLFMPSGREVEARGRFRHYFLSQHDADEAGAQKNRVKFVPIDMTKGSAAGYVIKYVSKNIDGYGVQRDLFGGDAVEGAVRVETWASTWGIRQFQQVGGPPVGVWRELRRLQADDGLSDRVERARAAADAGDWQEYTMVQGGPTVSRRDLAIEPAKSMDGERWCPVAGCTVPAPRTRYGEEPAGAVFGVRDVRKDRAFITRRFRWEVKRAVTAGGEASRPWTRVNNCTGGGDGRGAERTGKEHECVPDGSSGGALVGAAVPAAVGGGAELDASVHRGPFGRGEIRP